MSAETPPKIPTETELLIGQIKAVIPDESVALAEVAALRRLRIQIFTLDVYYDMLRRKDGPKAPSTQMALGLLYKRVRQFNAHLAILGLPSKYMTPQAVLSLFGAESDL